MVRKYLEIKNVTTVLLLALEDMTAFWEIGAADMCRVQCDQRVYPSLRLIPASAAPAYVHLWTAPGWHETQARCSQQLLSPLHGMKQRVSS